MSEVYTTENSVVPTKYNYNKESQFDDSEFMLPEQDATPEQVDKLPSKLAHQFSEEMDKLGIRSKVLEGGQNPLPDILKSLTLIDHDKLPDEPTVRLYRGIQPITGREIAHQVGYLLKHPTYDKYGHIDKVDLENDEVFHNVERFANNPSYRSLMQAVEVASMSDGDRRSVNNHIRNMRRNLIKFPTSTLVDELIHQHVDSEWSVPTQDLSPFVATSLHPDIAADRGNTLMVVDVPLSDIARTGEGGITGEVLITGSIKPEWIIAVAELHHNNNRTSTDTLAPLVEMLGGQETTSYRTFYSTEFQEKSEQNHQDDLREVNYDLIKEILSAQNIDANALREEYSRRNINTYKEALWMAADYYLKKIQEAAGQIQSEDIHSFYQCDDVTYSEPSLLPGGDDIISDLLVYEEPPKELNIKEVEKLASSYARLSKSRS